MLAPRTARSACSRTRVTLGRWLPASPGSQDAHGGDCLISIMPHCSSRGIAALLRMHPPLVRRLRVAPASVNPDPPQTQPDEDGSQDDDGYSSDHLLLLDQAPGHLSVDRAQWLYRSWLAACKQPIRRQVRVLEGVRRRGTLQPRSHVLTTQPCCSPESYWTVGSRSSRPHHGWRGSYEMGDPTLGRRLP